MEAATVAKQAPAEPAPTHDGAAEATRSTEELFQWSTYVHVGPGATECEHAIDGECAERIRIVGDGSIVGHFHAWLCLPNAFQQRDITDRAQAAKARKRRALQDPESDAHLVLEEHIEAWGLTDETFTALVQQVAQRRVEMEFGEITEELNDSEAFEHYGADLEEFRRLADLPEAERDGEDWERLEKEIEGYRLEFDKRAKERFESEKYRLEQMPRADVLDIERRHRVDTVTGEQFLHTYYTWAYYTCVRKPVLDEYPSERVFPKPEALRDAAPEIIVGLRTAYRALESRLLMRSDAAGN
jgi:hypothetical protein